MINAKKVAGSNIQVDEQAFLDILERKETGLVTTAKSGLFSNTYFYQVSFQGYIFLLKTKSPISIPADFVIVVAEKIYNPVLAV